jgi:flagellar basal body-associated protein FliL
MIIILIVVFAMLLIAIVGLCFNFYGQKKAFETSTSTLRNNIQTLNQVKEIQSNQLSLSDTLSNQLKESNQVLSKTILDVNVDLFSISFNKKES